MSFTCSLEDESLSSSSLLISSSSLTLQFLYMWNQHQFSRYHSLPQWGLMHLYRYHPYFVGQCPVTPHHYHYPATRIHSSALHYDCYPDTRFHLREVDHTQVFFDQRFKVTDSIRLDSTITQNKRTWKRLSSSVIGIITMKTLHCNLYARRAYRKWLIRRRVSNRRRV